MSTESHSSTVSSSSDASVHESWSGKGRYLETSRFQYHNDDYIEFLVQRVWKLTTPCRIIDFGCGRGYLAALLEPFLAVGSDYTGIDVSEELLEEARRAPHGPNLPRTFVCGDAYRTPFPNGSFDVAICQALLMHMADPFAVLQEMRRVTRPGGMIICCEANRSAVNAALFIEELPALADLGLLQRLFAAQRKRSGKDPDIGVKLPILFQRLGLENIQARITDSVRCVLPPLETEDHRAMFRAVLSEMPGQISDESAEAIRVRFEALGLTREDAELQIRNERRQGKEFAASGEQFHTVLPQMMLFCSGVVPATVSTCNLA